jgi:hypothetical protein
MCGRVVLLQGRLIIFGEKVKGVKDRIQIRKLFQDCFAVAAAGLIFV